MLPQGRPATSPGSTPRVEYDITLPANRGVTLRLRLSPTLDTIGSEGVRIGVSLDEGEVHELVMDLEATCCAPDTPAKQRWYDAVIDNGVTLSADMAAVPAGAHTVKVWRLDDNVVLERIEVELR